MATCPNCTYEINSLIKVIQIITENTKGYRCTMKGGELICESESDIKSYEEKTIVSFYCPSCDGFLFNKELLAKDFLRKWP